MAEPSRSWSARRALCRLPYFLIGLGFAGWFGGGLVNVAGRHFVPDSVQLPLSQPEGLAVDREGRIYIASAFYHRVQVYDARGRFLLGWFLPRGHKSYRLRIGEDGNLEAVAHGRLFRLTAAGEELSSRAVTESTQDSVQRFGCRVNEPYAGHYEIRDVFGPGLSILPRVVNIQANGRERTVVWTPWTLWPLQAVLPAFGWVVVGMAWLALRRLAPKPAI